MCKILTLNPVVFISNLYENYKRNQDELKRKKLEIIYSYFFKIYYKMALVEEKTTRAFSKVDLPEFLYEEKRNKYARKKTLNVVLEIIRRNEINSFYPISKINKRRLAK